ncbi:MAG: hypothetical protein ING36_04425 [Burkholderiales bacterium]|jgi:hypothetical protein|nr:hypothetical protein [Burkholderiales bacterium]MCA3160866.1 hypothetical protein [Burkholderiales bacterium]MCA3163655.1 hypothetical protein [Burkholderiales bacterium]MCA3166576.1 hypothetical protein [Burkholderiales bacterium]MCA3170041.1 hypothetical protein [Burkholderiales bacterium]
MPYIQRDPQGVILALSREASEDFSEFLPASAPEIREFIFKINEYDPWSFESADKEFIRVLDDLIGALIEKNLLRFTDFPEAAQKKLLARKSLRKEIQGLDLLDTN